MHESRCSPRITVNDHSWLAFFFFFIKETDILTVAGSNEVDILIYLH